jgi:hypothetical protein
MRDPCHQSSKSGFSALLVRLLTNTIVDNDGDDRYVMLYSQLLFGIEANTNKSQSPIV